MAWLSNFFLHFSEDSEPDWFIICWLHWLTSRWKDGAQALTLWIAFHTQCTNCGALRSASVFSMTLQIAGQCLWERLRDSSELPDRRLTSVTLMAPFGLFALRLLSLGIPYQLEKLNIMDNWVLQHWSWKKPVFSWWCRPFSSPPSWLKTAVESQSFLSGSPLPLYSLILPKAEALSSSVQYLDIKIPKTTISASHWIPPHRMSRM